MIERYTRPQMAKIWSEENKFRNWLKVEIAVCEAWAEEGVVPGEDVEKIKNAKFDLDRIAQVLEETHHDMTAFLRSVTESLGQEGRFVHLGLTSSDVMDTALGLQLVEASQIIEKDVADVILTLEDRAREHKYTLSMGRTHGVHAEPTTFGLKLALWAQEMRRNLTRIQEAKKMIAVGKISGAVGTYATVSPEVEFLACSSLGLQAEPVSNQVVQRDRHAQFVSTLAVCAGSLEKFATELRLLQRTETLEVEEPFSEGQTGSSAMPHKRNPELCERICGQARLMRSFAMTALENIALWGERDISHSSTERIILPDACTLLDYMLDIFNKVMRGLQIYPERMRENVEITKGLVFSQRVLIALIEGGMSRQEAYKIVQDTAMRAWRERSDFRELLRSKPEVTGRLSQDDMESLFDYGYYTRHVDGVFSRLGL